MSTEANVWDPARYAANASFVPRFGEAVVDLLTLPEGARVLDVGCGDGVLSLVLEARGYRVYGVDASPEMVTAARARGIDAHVADAADLSVPGPFDAVFSNATLHWLVRADAVLRGVRAALRPGGRFVGEFGGAGNVEAVVVALASALARRGLDGAAANPWYFPSVAEYAQKLEAAGFRIDGIGTFERPTPLPGSVTDWIETFGQRFLAAVAPAERPSLLAEVEEALAPTLRDAAGRWTLDYVRLRFSTTAC